MSFIEICPRIPRQVRKCLLKAYLTIFGLVLTLSFDLIDLKIYTVHLCPLLRLNNKFSEFPQAIFKISCSQAEFLTCLVFLWTWPLIFWPQNLIVHLWAQLHLSCKVDEIPTSGLQDLVMITDGWMIERTRTEWQLIASKGIKRQMFWGCGSVNVAHDIK